MADLLLMPKLGMDMETGVIGKWLKNEGDAIKKGEPIAEIETDKSTVEVESLFEGKILKLLVKEGEEKPCNTPIAAIGQPGENIPTGDTSKAKEEPKAEAKTEGGANLLLMPKLGMDMEEGTIEKWLKKEGDLVKKGEPIAEIETDKSTVEVESLFDGTILKIFVGEGEAKKCNTPIAAIGNPGDAIPSENEKVSKPVEQEKTNPVEKVANVPTVNTGVNTSNKKVRSTPRARKLAEKLNIDISLVTPTGPNGRIVEQDVRDYKPMVVNAGNAVLSDPNAYKLIPLTPMRKTIARRMLESTSNTPTFTLEIRVDMTKAIELRDAMKAKKVKVSFHDIIAKCACAAAKLHPYINASYSEDGIHQYERTNVGIAVSVNGGLVVPVVSNIDNLRISEIAQKSSEVIAKAREGKLSPSDMKGGHFTISNLGMYPLNSFTAIINPPESCILACAGFVPMPKVVNGELKEITTMSITATFDHRLVDGAYGAEFMTTLKEYIENPAMIIM